MFRHLAAVLNSILLATAATIGASAQAQATPTAQTYYVDTYPNASCQSVDLNCFLAFAKMPEKYILFNTVSCYVESTQPLYFMSFGVRTSPTGDVVRRTFIPLPPSIFRSNSYPHTYLVNQPVGILFGPGRYPVIVLAVTASATTNVECTITGEAVAGP